MIFSILHTTVPPCVRYLLLTCIVWSSCCLPGVQAATAEENFPVYPCIQTNVKFWEDVYSRYTTRQGILHDKDQMNRIYAVIDLIDWDESDAARINNERIKEAKKQISDILTDLSSGKQPVTPEEKRIAALFPPQRHTTYLKAQDNIRLQIGQKDRYLEGLVRSGRYLSHIKRIFSSEGLPTELAYLPHVESSFNPKAYSKAGAAGLWQFTRATGGEYMTVNALVDERYDPYLSTLAAAQLLKGNYAQLKTWPLALTAYNHGRTGVLRAVNEKGCYENIFNSYDQGAFKFASRNFYSEFLAAMRVAKRFERDPRINFDRPEATVTFRLKKSHPISQLRSSFQISNDEFARLNPALTKLVLDGQRPVPQGFLVRLPAKNQKNVQQAEIQKKRITPTAVVRTATSTQNSRTQKSVSRYTVKKGDTLYSIARTFQTTPKQVLAANGNPQTMTIKIGDTLTIPVAGGNSGAFTPTVIKKQP